MSFHIIHKPAANTAFLCLFAAFPSLDNAAVRWQKASVPIVFKRGGK
jgi:hypothetical protein